MIRDIITMLDQDFLDQCDAAIKTGEHVAKVVAELQQQRRWRDGKGVVHDLHGYVAHNVSLTTTVVRRPACGYRYESNRQCGATEPVTCLGCLAAGSPTYRCTCGHYEFEHEGFSGCVGCDVSGVPTYRHAYVADYANPVDPHDR